jgi:hypothetical protein
VALGLKEQHGKDLLTVRMKGGQKGLVIPSKDLRVVQSEGRSVVCVEVSSRRKDVLDTLVLHTITPASATHCYFVRLNSSCSKLPYSQPFRQHPPPVSIHAPLIPAL